MAGRAKSDIRSDAERYEEVGLLAVSEIHAVARGRASLLLQPLVKALSRCCADRRVSPTAVLHANTRKI